MQKFAPNQAIIECFSWDQNAGESASEIWATFNPHSHPLSYWMLALMGE